MVLRLFQNLGQVAQVRLLTGHAGGRSSDPPGVQRSPLPGLAGYLAWLAWRLPIELVRGDVDVILSSGALIGSLVEVAARSTGRAHAMLAYGTDLTYPSAAYQLWLRWSLGSLPLLLAISDAAEREARARGVARRGRIARVAPGVDAGMPAAPWERELTRPDRAVLLFVGRVIERKGLEPFLLECLPTIARLRPVEVWVVGGEPEGSLAHRPGALARLRERLAAAGVADQVRFFGAVPDETLRAAYRCATLLVLPAIALPGDMEGFGIVFLEAALFGVPAVSTRTGGIPEAVVDGETGLLVDPGDWRAFAAATLRLLDDDRLRRDLGERARSRARREYDWVSVADRCHRLLAEARRG